VTADPADPNPANNSATTTINTVDPATIPAVSGWSLLILACVLALIGMMAARF